MKNETKTSVTENPNKTTCPHCGDPMLLHFALNPFRPIVACAACKTYVNNDGQIKTAVG